MNDNRTKIQAMFDSITNQKRMSADSLRDLLTRMNNPGFLAFIQDRSIIVHRPDALPADLAGRDLREPAVLLAQPGEYYCFQVVVYALEHDLNDAHIIMDIPYKAQCFNTGGTDCWGNALEKTVDIKKGVVQVFWVGVEIPKNGADITGSVTVSAGGDCAVLPLELKITGEILGDFGDSEPERLSRLRWLHSTIALDDEITHPYSPLSYCEETRAINCLGRRVTLGTDGLPCKIESFFNATNEYFQTEPKAILSRPIVFNAGGGQLAQGVKWLRKDRAKGCWESEVMGDGYALKVEGVIEYDGFLSYRLTVTANKNITFDNQSLDIYYDKRASRYAMGLGVKGGFLTSHGEDWHWDRSLNQDTLWMGDVNAGLMARLYGENYEKPYMLFYYHFHPLNIPECWDNCGKGGIKVVKTDEYNQLHAYTGARHMEKGESITFLFDLQITPVKPIDKHEHWHARYYHRVPEELREVSAARANVINIHHSEDLNPFINDLCFETEALREYATKCHENGIKVKLYDTVKEYTIRSPYFFPFQSLGGEILPASPDMGDTWLGAIPETDAWMEDHIVSNYMTAWRSKLKRAKIYKDEMEASTFVAPMSRFNNYWLQQIDWVMKNTRVDGLYFDSVAFDRSIMKRVRKVLDYNQPGCTIDLHSSNTFKNNNVEDIRKAGWSNVMNLYIDNLAFIDRIWFGESFDYNETPDYWLIEVSGLPFGIMGEMLQFGGNAWRGMVYGMTNRHPQPKEKEPTDIWKLWDDFRIADAAMFGYWNPQCPVRTDNADVLATVYKAPDRALLSIGSWCPQDTEVNLLVDWKALGLDKSNVAAFTPEIRNFQSHRQIDLDQPIFVEKEKGLLIILSEIN